MVQSSRSGSRCRSPSPDKRGAPGKSISMEMRLLGFALAIVLLMAPAAYHRLVYDGEEAEDMHRTGSRFVTFASAGITMQFGFE